VNIPIKLTILYSYNNYYDGRYLDSIPEYN